MEKTGIGKIRNFFKASLKMVEPRLRHQGQSALPHIKLQEFFPLIKLGNFSGYNSAFKAVDTGRCKTIIYRMDKQQRPTVW